MLTRHLALPASITQTPSSARVSCRTYRHRRRKRQREPAEDDRTLLIADEGRATLYRVAPASSTSGPRRAPLPAAAPPAGRSKRFIRIRYASADDGPNVWPRRTQAVKCAINDPTPTSSDCRKWRHAGRLADRNAADACIPRCRPCRWCPTRRFASSSIAPADSPRTPGTGQRNARCCRISGWTCLNAWLHGSCSMTGSPKSRCSFSHPSGSRWPTCRRNGLALVRSRIESLAGDAAVIVTGDLNLSADSDLARTLIGASAQGRLDLADTFRAIFPQRDIDEATFNGQVIINGERIDWILASPRFAAVGASIERTRPVNTFASDHFMVTAHLVVRPASR